MRPVLKWQHCSTNETLLDHRCYVGCCHLHCCIFIQGEQQRRTVSHVFTPLPQKYLQPHLQPPTTTIYEDDRDALTAQFDAAEERLKEIQAETEAIRASVDAQHEKIEQTTSQVQSVVQDMKEGEQKTRNELREIREEIDTVREMLPKVRSHSLSMLKILAHIVPLDDRKEQRGANPVTDRITAGAKVLESSAAHSRAEHTRHRRSYCQFAVRRLPLQPTDHAESTSYPSMATGVTSSSSSQRY